MTPEKEAEANAAAEARIGARLLRQHAWARGYSRDALAFAARMLAEGSHTNGGMVYRATAEAMFDWPVYRAALEAGR